MLLLRLARDVRDARWYPTSSDYVLYTDARGLFAVELDDRGGSRNTVDLLRGSDIELVSIDAEHILFIAQGKLRRLPWEAE